MLRRPKIVQVIGEAKIDPKKIPAAEYETMCRVLNRSIRLALSDPAKKADFEEWKQARLSSDKKK